MKDKQPKIWRAVLHHDYVFLVSPDGYAFERYTLDEAERDAKAENMRLEVETLAREGKL